MSEKEFLLNLKNELFISFEQVYGYLFQLADLVLKLCSSKKVSDTKSSWIFQEIRNHKGKLKEMVD